MDRKCRCPEEWVPPIFFRDNDFWGPHSRVYTVIWWHPSSSERVQMKRETRSMLHGFHFRFQASLFHCDSRVGVIWNDQDKERTSARELISERLMRNKTSINLALHFYLVHMPFWACFSNHPTYPWSLED